jgi:hypothetical protein
MAQRVKVKVKLAPERNWEKFRTLPRVEKLMMDCGGAAAQDAEAATGEEFGYATSPGTRRAAVAVFPDSYEAAREVARHPYKLIGAMRAVKRVV